MFDEVNRLVIVTILARAETRETNDHVPLFLAVRP